MYILKYFYEEPFFLDESVDEPFQPGTAPFLDRGRPAFRGYLAGSRLDPREIGLTALPAEAFVPPLVEVFGRMSWHCVRTDGKVRSIPAEELDELLACPAEVALLWQAVERHDSVALSASAAERITRSGALLPLLGIARIVIIPEPAHDGYDLSLYAPAPLRERMTKAFGNFPLADVRRFVLPYQRARSEERFYFEFWQLDDLPEHITEV